MGSNGVEVGVGAIGVEDFVAIHDGDEVVGVGEVDDVVGVAGEHLDRLDVVAADLVVPYLIGAFFAEADETVTADDDEGFPLAVVPVLTLGDAGLGDVDADLPAMEAVAKFCEGAARVGVHLEVIDGFLTREIGEIGGHELVAETAGGHFNHVDATHIGGCFGAFVDDVHYLTERGFVGDGYEAVASAFGGDCLYSVKLTSVFVAC